MADDPLYWRLYYPDDSYQDEPAENASIRAGRPGAFVIAACTRKLVDGQEVREPICRIHLNFEGHYYKPIWYRQRSITIDPKRPDLSRVIELEATVIGRARDADPRWEGTVWASIPGSGEFGDCPAWALDEDAIKLILEA